MIHVMVTALALALALPAALVAQGTPNAVASPAASPLPTSSPDAQPARRKLYVKGPQFISIGAVISPRVQSEFRPSSTVGTTSIEGWQTGESTLLGRFRVIGYTDYRSFSFDHLGTERVATIGGGGSALVPSFRVHDDELDFGGGLRIAPHVFMGLATTTRQETSGYPPIKGIGYLLLLAPSTRPAVSPYGWIVYEPNAGGVYALSDGTHTAITYRGMRYRFGALFSPPGSRLVLDVGFAGENMYNRTNVPARLADSMIVTGLGIHF